MTAARVLLFIVLLLPILSFAQTLVTGKIVSSTDQTPLPGVSVLLKGTRIGVSTSVDGVFSIHAKKGDVLVLSGVGVTHQEFTVDAEKDIVISVKADSKNMEEVVVTALGIKKEAKRIGYSIQEVKAADVLKAREPNPIGSLVGKVAGLTVGVNQELLSSPVVLLRGNPITFYVVDGIPINSDTWNISPDDIETFSILKGPAASALYGNRGIFGAILITTKHGARNKKGWQVEINSSNQINKGFIAIPKVQNQYGPGDDQKYAFGDGLGGGINDADYDVWGPIMDGRLIPQWNGPVTPGTTYKTTFVDGSFYNGDIMPTPFKPVGVNNMQHFLQAGILTTNNINLSSVTDRSNIRMSVTQGYQRGVTPNTELNRLNFNIYGSYDITSNFKVEGSLNYNRQFTPNIPDVDYGPNSIVYDIDVWTGSDWNINDPKIKNYWPAGGGVLGDRPTFIEYKHYQNPWFVSQQWLRGHYKNDLYGYINLNYKLGHGFEVQARSNVTTYDVLRTEKLPWYAHPYSQEYNNHGNYREDRRSLWENNTEAIVKYNGNLGNSGFNLFAIAGATARNFKYSSNFTTTNQLGTPDVFNFDNSLFPTKAYNFNSNMLVLSAYASVDLTYKKYVTLSATGREDKSSALPLAQNAYFYPSASLSTVISDYTQLPQAISFLKLRASYANVKDGGTSSYIGETPTAGGYIFDYGADYLTTYGGPSYGLATPYNLSSGYNNNPQATSPTQLVNANIKPATYTNYEGGFDIRFLKNRLGLSGTYFEYVKGPLQDQSSVAESSGYLYYTTNAQKTQKTGEEFTIQGTPVQARHFRWDVTVNWSKFKEIYKSLPGGYLPGPGGAVIHNGDRTDNYYAYIEAKNSAGQVINDSSGLPLYLPIEKVLGHSDPDWTWGIVNKFAYNNFTLSFQFDGMVGGKLQDEVYTKLMEGGRGSETVQGKLGQARLIEAYHLGDPGYKGAYVNGKAVLAEGVQITNGGALAFDNNGNISNDKQLTYQTNNSTPVYMQNYSSGPLSDAEHTTTNKTYAKLREVVFGYSLPASILGKSGISRIDFSLVGRNLLYFFNKKFKDVDVDQYPGRNMSDGSTVQSSGLQTPTTRSYGFNVNIVF